MSNIDGKKVERVKTYMSRAVEAIQFGLGSDILGQCINLCGDKLIYLKDNDTWCLEDCGKIQTGDYIVKFRENNFKVLSEIEFNNQYNAKNNFWNKELVYQFCETFKEISPKSCYQNIQGGKLQLMSSEYCDSIESCNSDRFKDGEFDCFDCDRQMTEEGIAIRDFIVMIMGSVMKKWSEKVIEENKSVDKGE